MPGQPFANALHVMILWLRRSQGCRNPGLELANAFSVIPNTRTCDPYVFQEQTNQLKEKNTCRHTSR